MQQSIIFLTNSPNLPIKPFFSLWCLAMRRPEIENADYSLYGRIFSAFSTSFSGTKRETPLGGGTAEEPKIPDASLFIKTGIPFFLSIIVIISASGREA